MLPDMRDTTHDVLQLRLDSSDIIIGGAESQGRRPFVSGEVVLQTTDAITIRNVKVTLQGIRKVEWLADPQAVNPQVVKQKEIIFLQEQHLFLRTKATRQSDKHRRGSSSWPFAFMLDHEMPESVDGLESSYIAYSVTATVSTGVLHKVLRTSERIRIIKEPPWWADNLQIGPHDVLANRLIYEVSLPQAYQYVNDDVVLDFKLIPLNDDQSIGAIKVELLQTVFLLTQRNNTKRTFTISKLEENMPENFGNDKVRRAVPPQEQNANYDNATAPNDAATGALEDEPFKFSLSLPTNKSPFPLLQSVNDERMKVKHTLKVCVDLHNPEGNKSQLHIEFYPKFYLHPSTPTGNRRVSSIDATSLPFAASCAVPTQQLPPCYGDHVFDFPFRPLRV